MTAPVESPAADLHPAAPAGAPARDDEPGSRSIARRAFVAGLVILVAGCVAFALVRELGHAGGIDWRFRPGWLAAASAGFVALHLTHAELWRRLVGTLGVRTTAGPAWRVWFLSALARYVPSSMLMVVFRVSMGSRIGIPRRIGTSIVFHEAALAFVGALLVSAWYLVQLDSLADTGIRYAMLALPVVALIALHPRVFDPLADRVMRRMGREPLDHSVTMRTGVLIGFATLYAASFALAGLSLFALASSMVDVNASDLPVVVAAFAVGYNLSVLGAVLPGGLGVREAGLAAALSTVMPAAAAAAVAVAVRVVQLVIELLAAAVAQILDRRRRRVG